MGESAEGDEEREEPRLGWGRGLLVAAVALLVVYGVAPLLLRFVATLHGVEAKVAELGAFGDQFGAANIVVSGLALCGAIYAIVLQSHELKLQRREVRLQREELARQRKEFEKLVESSREQTEEQRKHALLQATIARFSAAEQRLVANMARRTGLDQFALESEAELIREWSDDSLKKHMEELEARNTLDHAEAKATRGQLLKLEAELGSEFALGVLAVKQAIDEGAGVEGSDG